MLVPASPVEVVMAVGTGSEPMGAETVCCKAEAEEESERVREGEARRAGGVRAVCVE